MSNLPLFAALAWRRQTESVVARFAFCLDANKAAHEIAVRWPGGATQILKSVAADQVLEVVEP